MSQPASIRLQPTEQNIAHCADLLRSGELVAVPTETVYGLAGNALTEASARKIFAVKGRPLIDPLIAHFHQIESASQHIELNPSIERAAEAFWPGPLTIVAPKKPSIPDIVTAGLPSAAIRIPGHPVLRKLLAQLEFPLAAPSANPFGYVSPTQATHVERTLGHQIKAILDAGPCQHGVESTILDLRNASSPRILREGPISREAISEALKIEAVNATQTTNTTGNQTAPGRLTQHYSPNTPVELHTPNSLQHEQVTPDEALVLLKRPTSTTPENVYWLSEQGDLSEIAHNLFDLVQTLDLRNFRCLHIETCPESGLGRAVNDRLRRAAAKRNS